jgi:hypothetical protein
MGDSMKRFLSAALAALVLSAVPAAAITFPSLTTIYVGSGVTDRNGMINIATVFHCTNVSGQSANIRYRVLNTAGAGVGSLTVTVAHGAHHTAGTRDSFVFNEQVFTMGDILQGTVNIESTQSGVFCSSMIVDPSTTGPNGMTLRLVRVNGHPGVQE